MEDNVIYFKRKIYNTMLKWKSERNGDTALLIQGARRIGKSTIVEEFARHEYKSYILLSGCSSSIRYNCMKGSQ